MSITHEELPVFDLPQRTRHLTAVPALEPDVLDVLEAAPSPEPGLQLTRRGRVVLTLLALVIVTALMVVFGSGTAATDQAGTVTGTTTITVQPGETLWSIAGAANPGGDIRDTMDDIVKLNSLVAGQPLQMGTQLAVPVYAD